MTPEFKAALIEACAKGGVEIQNLSEEDRAVYNGFVPKEEKTEEKKEEKQEKETSYSVKVMWFSHVWGVTRGTLT